MQPLWRTMAFRYFTPKVLFINLCLVLGSACVFFLLETTLIFLFDKHLPADPGFHFYLWIRVSLRTFLACYVGVAIGLLLDKIQNPAWMSQWESLQWVLYGEYDCSNYQGSRGREVRVCVPHPVESKKWRYDVSPAYVSTQDVDPENRKSERVLKDPWKPLIVLKSKKGFGIWNTEVNMRVERVFFTPGEVVVDCDLLNEEGVSRSQRREYRIPWKKRHAPTSGLLRGSGVAEERPCDVQNAFPEYVPADSLSATG